MAKKKERSPTDTPDGAAIVPGMVCTMQMYSDRNVYLVDRVSDSGKTVYIKRAASVGGGLKAKRPVKWVPMLHLEEYITKVQRNPKGHWRTIGSSAPCFVYMGVANPYYDRSF